MSFFGFETSPGSPVIYIGPYAYLRSPKELVTSAGALIGVDQNGIIAFVTPVDTCDTELVGATLLTAVEEYVSSKYAGLDSQAQAQVAALWKRAPVVNTIDQTGASNSFFFPGFIDTHIHAAQHPNLGQYGKGSLLEWLLADTFPLEATFKDPAYARKVYEKVVNDTLRNGTTTAMYFATIHVDSTNLLADICHERGQRAFVGRVCMDDSPVEYYCDESVESAIKDTHTCINHIRKLDPKQELIQPVITPRFSLACSPELLKRLGDMHQSEKIFVQTHISEMKEEVEEVCLKFPENKGYLDTYHSAGLVSDLTVLAHAIYLTDEEIAVVKSTGANISHCPTSNSALSSGIAPVRKLVDAGIEISLGTDVSGGYTASILHVARHAVLMSRHRALIGRERGGLAADEAGRLELSPLEALYFATRGGANTLGLGRRVGAIEPGRAWDAQLVRVEAAVGERPKRPAAPGEVPPSAGGVDSAGVRFPPSWKGYSLQEMVLGWLFTGDDRNTTNVWIQGRLVHHKSS